jgi:hypothetical protein
MLGKLFSGGNSWEANLRYFSGAFPDKRFCFLGCNEKGKKRTFAFSLL